MKDIIEPVDTDDGLFHDGDPSTGVEGTIVSALTMNAMQGGIISVQRELKNILQSADINIDENNDAQVIAALRALFQPLNNTLTAFAKLATGANKLPYFTGPKSADLADLTEVGRDILAKTSVDAVLKYLGLGAGAPAIGIPFFWPSSAMPNTVMPEWSDMVFLKFNNATFSAATYPKLALVYPELKLPEMRGEFLRVWDDGRGIDSGRALLSAQGDAIRNITGSFGDAHAGVNAAAGGVLAWRTDGTRAVTGLGDWKFGQLSMDVSRQVPTAPENRPRNIAFNFLVRAK